MKGWVYVITNKAMPDLVKVGFSTKDPDLRAKELGSTGTPHPYKVQYEVLVENPYLVEQKTHKVLRKNKEGKEWFRCEVGDAITAIKTVVNTNIIYEKTNIKKSAVPEKNTSDIITNNKSHSVKPASEIPFFNTAKAVRLYKKGDTVNAIKIFKKAGEEGEFWSCHILAAHYKDIGLKQQKDEENIIYNENYKKSFYWVKKAVEAEDVMGSAGVIEKANDCYLLGVFYMDGYGTEQNINKAIFWLKKASADGNEPAKRVLKEYEKAKATPLERIKRWLF